MQPTYYEVVITGSGIVGAALAQKLAQAGFHVLVIDPTPPSPVVDDIPPDLRVSAISCTSVAFLRRIGAWQRIGDYFCVPYRRIETWEWPCSTVVFDATSINLPELGFIVENRRLRQALWQGFADCDTLTLRCPAALDFMVYDGTLWSLKLTNGDTITSRIVIGADGAQSLVRRQAGIAVSGWQYRQSCLLLSIVTEDQQQDVTWQEWHHSGPRAFLPLYGRWASLVWYDSSAHIRQLEKLPLSALAHEVRMAFPARLGPFILHGAASFLLTRQHAHEYVKPGLAIIGDAAHTIHPLAGQGANLGLRDAEALAETLIVARKHEQSWEQLTVLQGYQRRRRIDNLLMQAGIDVFYAAFSNELPPLILARNLCLMLAERAGSVKKQVLRYALGW